MNSSSDPARRPDRDRRLRTAQNVLLWSLIIVLAVLPYPWW